MNIFDCCIFSDEKMLLNLRFNVLNKFVQKFIVVEANFTHSGHEKKFNFDINDYPDFKDKIIYYRIENLPKNLHKISDNFDEESKSNLKILNALILENFHRNYIYNALLKAKDEDLIIISDVDEIPNLENLSTQHLKKDIIIFKQLMCYYKFNLKHPTLEWFGSKATIKKKLKSPQWLRNIKNKIYPFWRIDTFFSNNKSTSISIVENGGWHFTNIKEPKKIYQKFLTFLHHVDFEESGLLEKDIEHHVKNETIPYNHNLDKSKKNWSENIRLEKLPDEDLPNYIQKNYKNYSQWIKY